MMDGMNPTAQETNAADARLQAVAFGEVTCLGTLDQSFPIQSGNCFSVITADGRSFKIVNFVYENLVEALRRGTSDDRWAPGVAWPVQCVEIGRAVRSFTTLESQRPGTRANGASAVARSHCCRLRSGFGR